MLRLISRRSAARAAASQRALLRAPPALSAALRSAPVRGVRTAVQEVEQVPKQEKVGTAAEPQFQEFDDAKFVGMKGGEIFEEVHSHTNTHSYRHADTYESKPKNTDICTQKCTQTHLYIQAHTCSHAEMRTCTHTHHYTVDAHLN
jgi:hypothetical protein